MSTRTRPPIRIGIVVCFVLALCTRPVTTAAPASIVAYTPTVVSLAAGQEVLVAVQVLDAGGNPVPEPDVHWQAPAAGPSAVMFGPTQQEDGLSVIAAQPTGGLGTYQITASIAGLPPVTFFMTNVAGPLNALQLLRGGDQSTMVNTAFAEPLKIRAVDVALNPLAGVPVTFQRALSGASATLSQLTATTDGNGEASLTATANGFGGVHSVQASAPKPGGGVALTAARLSNLTLVPAGVTLVGGNAQEAPLDRPFPNQLEVRITAAGGAPIPNVAVEFAGPLAGAGVGTVDANPAPFPVPGGGRVFTDPGGVARLSAYANAELGSYAVTARVAGLVATFNFVLTNIARVPYRILANGTGDVAGESTPPGQRFTNLAFRVVDVTGAGVPDVAVTLEPPATGPSVTPDQLSLVTDAGGWARTQGTANPIPGTYGLSARVDALADPGSLLLQNRPVGYDIGQQLADPAGFDDAGQQRSLRSFLSEGKYLVLDVCAGWCSVCMQAQPDGQAAKSELASRGIPVAVVPLLVDSIASNSPSSQSDAASWRAQFHISDPVLHASQTLHSPAWEAGWFVLDVVRPGFPTYLLVGPDGTVLARHVGVLFNDDFVNFVTSNIPSELSIGDVALTEGNGGVTATLTVTRSRGGSIASVNYATASGSAGPGDFTAKNGTLQFASGDRTATIIVPITGDSIDEPNEAFTVALSNAVGGSIARGQATVTILDDDPTPVATIDDVHVSEGNSGLTKALLPVHLDRPSASPISMNYATALGTASSRDVVSSAGTVVFQPGQTLQNVGVSISADTLIESKETFFVNLSPATGGVIIADNQAVVTIVDDDFDTLPPVITQKADVIVEVKMSASSTTVVSYANPLARDNRDGDIDPGCAPASGSRFGYGRTTVFCTAEDRAGNVAAGSFAVVVQLPAVSGAVFAASAPDGPPLTQVHAGDHVIVRVNAGAFERRAKIRLSFVDSAGRTFLLRHDHASESGALDVLVVIPPSARRGPGQLFAVSESHDAEFDRTWMLTVIRERRPHSHGGHRIPDRKW